jgi:uncharacterized protein (TIGR02646 family)
LPRKLRTKLAAETAFIVASENPKAEADRRYSNARNAGWFKPVVDALKKLSGHGQRCMFCSGSEASDVEHYKPKAVFPELAMTWENYLWSCAPCNRGQSSRFPPCTEPGGQFVNPLREDVWEFFFIDEFGFLTPRYDKAAGALNERAASTRDLLDLNREAVQETRLARLSDLKEQVNELVRGLKQGRIKNTAAQGKIKVWLSQPFQPDVADYFLNGPGKTEQPFKKLLKLV